MALVWALGELLVGRNIASLAHMTGPGVGVSCSRGFCAGPVDVEGPRPSPVSVSCVSYQLGTWELKLCLSVRSMGNNHLATRT